MFVCLKKLMIICCTNTNLSSFGTYIFTEIPTPTTVATTPPTTQSTTTQTLGKLTYLCTNINSGVIGSQALR